MIRLCKILLTLLLAALVIAGCDRYGNDLRLIEPRLDIDRIIAEEFATLMDEKSSIEIMLVPSLSDDEGALDALLAGRADIALLSNNQPYHAEVTTVMPMYSNILHVLIRADSESDDFVGHLNNSVIFAGPPGTPSRLMLESLAADRGVDPDTISFVADARACPDVIVVFSPILRDIQSRLEQCGGVNSYRFWADQVKRMEAATLLNPSLRLFTIPAYTYGEELTPDAVKTLAVDKMLVARADVPAAKVYDLIREVIRLRPALAAIEPTLFHGIDDDFSANDSTFVMHPGSAAFVNRDEPTVYERYSGVAEVVVTIFFALLSGAIAGVRIYNLKRKNRIDEFYSAAIELRQSIDGSTSATDREAAITSMRLLQTRAFHMLVSEKLAADESFRIFITLSNDIIRELKQPSAPDWPAVDN